MTLEEALRDARGRHARGDLAGAIEGYRRLLEQDAGHAEAWHLMAVAEQQSGMLEAALESARSAIAAGGERAPFLLLEGDILHERGELAAADERFARVVAAMPAWAPGWMALGRVRMDLGRAPEAEEAFLAATRAEPGNARAWNNLGVALERQERFDDAAQAFARAVSIEPRYALATLNLARIRDGRDSDAAAALAENAIRADPRLAEAWLLLSDIHRRRLALPQSLSALDSGLRFAPGDLRLLAARAEILSHQGRTAESRAEYEALSARFPESFRAALGANLTLPRVYESASHLEASRSLYAQGLERLLEGTGRYRFPAPEAALAESRWVNFYLAYQGRDDRDLQRRYGEVLARVLQPALPQFFEPRRAPARSRVRVGFYSHFFFNCVVGRYFASWITDLDKSRFEVFAYYGNETIAEDTRAIAAAADVFRHVSGKPLAAIAREVAADELDVLVYPELGMHPETFALAALRLAPVQCAGWGHPTTTGLSTIDWFISPGEMEPEGGEAHYAERLARLPGLGTRYALPQGDPSPPDRNVIGVPEGRTAYFVPQSLFKIHPDNDELLARVLSRDPSGVAVMFPSSLAPLTDAYRARLGKCLASHGMALDERVRFLAFAPHREYLRINQACDVMLDTVHWSGGNTSLDALACGLPVVTMPGALMRGRQSAAMLRAVGVPELVAQDADEYVETAVRLGRSRDERRAVSERIVRGREALFERGEPVRALEAFLERCAGMRAP
jgi:CRISPR-associated protein Csy1